MKIITKLKKLILKIIAKNKIKKLYNKNIFKIFFVILCLLTSYGYINADVVLTNEEYQQVLYRMRKNRDIIHNDNVRWKKLKDSKPKIIYDIKNGKTVIQRIEIDVYNADPLVYENIFDIDIKKEPKHFFCYKFFLGAFFETPPLNKVDYEDDMKVTDIMDIKFGMKFVTLEPTEIPFIRGLGLNILVGIQSFGGSISYTFSKYITNTSLHFFVGMNYRYLCETYGVGVTLYF